MGNRQATPFPILAIPSCNEFLGFEPTLQTEFPHEVLLKYNGDSICGGAIINSLIILTAAHCVVDRAISKFEVIAGQKQSQWKNVSEAVVHPNYNSTSWENNLALLVLDTPLNMTESVKPVLYLNSSREYDYPYEVTAIRWGGTGLNTTHKLKIPLVFGYFCDRRFERQLSASAMFCAGTIPPRTTCKGSQIHGSLMCPSPNPEQATNLLCGIISAGENPTKKQTIPAVYTEIKNFSDWIYTNSEKYANQRSLTKFPSEGLDRPITCREKYLECLEVKCQSQRNQCTEGVENVECEYGGKYYTGLITCIFECSKSKEVCVAAEQLAS